MLVSDILQTIVPYSDYGTIPHHGYVVYIYFTRPIAINWVQSWVPIKLALKAYKSAPMLPAILSLLQFGEEHF